MPTAFYHLNGEHRRSGGHDHRHRGGHRHSSESHPHTFSDSFSSQSEGGGGGAGAGGGGGGGGGFGEVGGHGHSASFGGGGHDAHGGGAAAHAMDATFVWKLSKLGRIGSSRLRFDDDFADRLNYQYTGVLMFLFIGLIGIRQYVGMLTCPGIVMSQWLTRDSGTRGGIANRFFSTHVFLPYRVKR
ncbi:Innexin [Fasciola gigantica]|uniref:Innexin n=1 Tax=Fasciola gigantica TaxID=46835 RepID=A0A504YBM3_FASGI|nr:Innexin [Fasciola gigantica]